MVANKALSENFEKSLLPVTSEDTHKQTIFSSMIILPPKRKPAFSKEDLLPMDLGTFYREFQNPPQLSSLSIDISAQSMAEDLDSLPEKLAVYERNIDEFDAFVDTLQ